ncbi:hypothetical protein LEP1GSC125_2798 [Leptospira mayottensis 200901122]|uniref:Uncharacterized protein n=1 Tax=Leptospira mayottensis 200901122 TaxID=1193010 RepID=A0AA87MME1_9LEPT|nr:hypothetical protein LEP1GSC125_2798 [Leptospira mayottensis 200901122]
MEKQRKIYEKNYQKSGILSDHEAEIKFLYLTLNNISKKWWIAPIQDWGKAMNQFSGIN